MDPLYTYFLGILFIYVVYILGKVFLALKLGIYDDEVFLGFGNYRAIKLNFKKLKVYFGLFIPLPFFAQFYRYKNGGKFPITYEWQFYDRPWYLRLIAIFGGSISALIASIFLFSILAYQEEDTYLSKEELNTYGVFPSKIAKEQGFRKGDKILRINGKEYERFSELVDQDLLNQDKTEYEISRNGMKQKIAVSWLGLFEDISNLDYLLVPNAPFKIGTVLPGEAAEMSGVLPGDVIQSINDNTVVSFYEAREYFQKFYGEKVVLEVLRLDQAYQIEVQVDEDGKIGFYPENVINYSYESKTFPEAIVSGVIRPFEIIAVNIRGLGKIFSGNIDTRKDINGPIRIANLFENDLLSFFRVCALLLVAIIFWDLLPLPRSAALKSIPVLIEVMFKKKVSLQVFNTIHKGGWALIMIFMIANLVNDMLRLP